MRRSYRIVFALSLGAVTGACGSDAAPGKTETPVNTQASAASTVPAAPVDANCPATGLWAVCSVEKRLKQSGFVAQKTDSVGEKRAGISVEPIAYRLNKSRLELYLYDNVASLQNEISKIDTTKVAPVFIRSGNLIALLFTDDGTQAERLALALTAGAPQR